MWGCALRCNAKIISNCLNSCGSRNNLRVREISFLAADVANPHVFGREANFTSNVALRQEDLPALDQTLRAMEREFAKEFATGFIAEKPEKLRRIWQYYSAICGRENYPPVRCNAPEFSAVVEADGRIRPCFFISGPREAGGIRELDAGLNANGMTVIALGDPRWPSR